MPDTEQNTAKAAKGSASNPKDDGSGVDAPGDHDPIKHGAQIVAGDDYAVLEHRLKSDIFASLCRIKPELKAHDFETEIMQGTLIPTLPAPLQGVAIARVEGTLSFYNRVGWHPQFLDASVAACVDNEEAVTTLAQRYHASTLHDLAYVHPRHFEKILGKVDAARLWERLKQYSDTLQG